MVQDIQLSIVFADICDSTKLYETLGDATARQSVSVCLRILREETEWQRGRVVKTIGDEVMAVFNTPQAAAEAVIAMQNRVSDGILDAGVTLRIRAGLHHGKVIVEDDGDVYGDAVNTAARLASQAKAAQILTTAATARRLPPLLRTATRPIDRVAVKGKRAEIEMIEILWQQDDLTHMATSISPLQATGKTRLLLCYRDREIEVSAARPSVVMGRADDGDLVVKHTRASRLHARVEHRKGHFVLVDQSINGTYVRTAAGAEAFVRRDSHVLEGAGIIALGQQLPPDSPDAISYRNET